MHKIVAAVAVAALAVTPMVVHRHEYVTNHPQILETRLTEVCHPDNEGCRAYLETRYKDQICLQIADEHSSWVAYQCHWIVPLRKIHPHY